MQKRKIKKLHETAQHIAKVFGDPERKKNYTDGEYSVEKVTPLSSDSAVVVLRQSNDVLSVVFCYWLNTRGGEWRYFFPTEAHVAGMQRLPEIMQQVDEQNFSTKLGNTED